MSDNPITVIDVTDYKTQYHDADVENTLLVDVREVDEYEAGHIPGAINLPLSEMEDRYIELGADKTLLLVCKTGGRSQMAAEFLAMAGYKKLVNVNGGTLGWATAGNPLEK